MHVCVLCTQNDDVISQAAHEQIIVALAPLLEKNRPTQEICNFFSKVCPCAERAVLWMCYLRAVLWVCYQRAVLWVCYQRCVLCCGCVSVLCCAVGVLSAWRAVGVSVCCAVGV
jgi:hypothetical protein